MFFFPLCWYRYTVRHLLSFFLSFLIQAAEAFFTVLRYASKTHNFTRFCYRMRRVRQQIATVCAVYASKLLPLAPHTLANCYRMRRLCQQFATACAAYASKVLPHAAHTLTNSKLLFLSFSSDETSFYTVLLPHVPCTLANSYRMRRLRQQCATVCGTYACNLLLYAQSTLASCYRMRRTRQKTATACAAYACKKLIFKRFCQPMRRLRQQFATICTAYASNVLPHALHTLANCYRMHCIRQQSSSQANFAILTK